MIERTIKVLHLEPTDVCQASCALCARETDPYFNKDQKHHLNMDTILKVFSTDHIAALDKMFMCGNYGDPAAGRHTLNIYKEFRKINPTIVLGMNTNGGLQNTTWWQNLGKVFNQSQDYVVFSIDGLEDTNAVYRTGVDWHRVMTNVKAFIDAGGSAHWDMLVYQHNQHQVDECQRLAKELGFRWFRAKVSKRGFTKLLQAPVGWNQPILNSNLISCHALNEQSVYIDACGRMSPCCWLGATQKDFVTNFKQIQESWIGLDPNAVCVQTCGSKFGITNFANQWQREVEL